MPCPPARLSRRRAGRCAGTANLQENGPESWRPWMIFVTCHSEGNMVLHRILLALAGMLALATAALADNADTCSDDNAEAAARADACTRLIRSGKYRGNHLAAVLNNRAIAYRRQNDLNRALADYNEAVRLDPQYYKAYFN